MKMYDTNILIHFLNKTLPVDYHQQFIIEIQKCFVISVIVKIELLGFHRHTKHSYQLTNELLEHAQIIYLDELITQECIVLRRQYNMRLPDAVIAATAKLHDMKLITANEKDFVCVDKLKVINPFA